MNPRIAGAALAVILLGASCSSASAGEVLESKTARAAPAPAAAAPLGTALDRFGGELFNTVGRSSSLTNANESSVRSDLPGTRLFQCSPDDDR